MQGLQSLLGFALLTSILPQVVSYSFNLTYQGRGNYLTFYCKSTGNYSSSQNFSFWINATEQIDILNGIPPEDAAVRVTEWVVYFNLQPQYEGIFYCGEMNGVKSNGIGPLIAIPDEASNSEIIVHGNRTINTLVCPIKLGALIQAYSVTWRGPNEHDGYVQNNTPPSASLTILGNIKYVEQYVCHVTVTNPIDGQVFQSDGHFTIIPCRFCKLSQPGIIAVLITNALFIICCCCWCCYFCCVCRSNNKIEDSFSSRTSATHIHMEPIGSNDTDTLSTQCKEHAVINIDVYNDLCIQMDGNIGNGTFGSVFRATYEGSPCAVKLLTHHAQEMATGRTMKSTRMIQKSSLECFWKECRYLKSLVHTNIVRYLATVTEPSSNLPMLVMELMDCSLKQYLEDRQDNKLPFIHQISLCSDISKGLAFLHAENIIHRDLCDDNVLIVTGDTPIAKIADFGMSRILPQDYMSDTLTGLGHRQVYLPSEARDYPYDYNHTLDIYSFGVLATQIVQVKTHIKRKEDLLAIFEEIRNTHLLKNIIRSCLSEDGKSRPQASDIVSQIT